MPPKTKPIKAAKVSQKHSKLDAKSASEIAPNSSKEEGNTQTPSSLETNSKKKQIPQRIHHFFTYNNYDSSIIPILETTFQQFCYMYAFQEETGENGTPHLQGVISCKKKMRDTEFDLPKEMHWESPRNIKDCYLYCTKEESRSGDVFTFNYTLPYTFKPNLYGWQLALLQELEKTPHERNIFWVWSQDGGKGKSTLCKHLVVNKKAVFCSSGKNSDIINVIHNSDMMQSNIVVFDLPRSNLNKVSYSAMESIKNGLICNTKFETGFKAFSPPHIIVFANAEPQYENMSEDRFIVMNIDTM